MTKDVNQEEYIDVQGDAKGGDKLRYEMVK